VEYEAVEYDLTDYAAGSSDVRIAFVLLGTDLFLDLEGVFFDDVRVTNKPPSNVVEASFGLIKALYR
jgi:hypothetical protein